VRGSVVVLFGTLPLFKNRAGTRKCLILGPQIPNTTPTHLYVSRCVFAAIRKCMIRQDGQPIYYCYYKYHS